jgi:alkanesulfonate monooxygenase SsuD/methylene tetrahydromethanopterin reductase-like flavin-dependent oxidoreductase (luciferase family)
LKQSLAAQILVGSLGPKMTQLGGSAADGVLLNWLTIDEAASSNELVKSAAIEAGRKSPHIAAYIRVAMGEQAIAKLAEESGRYESYPQYKRHFDRMGVQAIETAVYGAEPDALQSKLAAYEEVVDEAVVRAICANETFEDYVSLLRATAPK